MNNLHETAKQEPVAWRTFDGEGGWDYRSYEGNEDYIYQYIKRNGGKYANWVEPLYTHPHQMKPLTDEEIKQAVLDDPMYGAALMHMMRDDVMIAQLRQAISGIARAIEKAHGIGVE